MMASSVTSPPPGVFVPVPTFFKPFAARAAGEIEAAVDIETQVAHSVFLAKAGITGLVLLGSTGEAVHLSAAERKALVAGVRKGLDEAGFKDYPIQAGVLTNGIDETLEWLRDYKEAGAQWGLVLVPGYFGPAVTQENIKDWFEAVADKSPLPILIYNYPGVTNQILVQPETYRALAAHPNIVGAKLSHGNLPYHIQISMDPAIDHAKFRLYSGFGAQLAPIVFFGAAGVIDGLAAFYPKTVARLSKLVHDGAGPTDEVRKLQYAVARAEEFVGKFGIVGIKEAVFRVTGMGTLEGGRLPLKGKLPDGEWERGRERWLTEIEMIEKEL